MNLDHQLSRLTRVPRLSRTRIFFAVAVAVAADVMQFFFGLLGPVGWTFADDTIDVIAMMLTMWALGFHLLLLPTFVVKLVPVIDMLPTWTGCVAAVIALRKRAERSVPPVIDV